MNVPFLFAVLLVITCAYGEIHDDAFFDLMRQSDGDRRVLSFVGHGSTDEYLQHPPRDDQQRHRQLRTEFINACHNPDILYAGTGTSGRCICDEEYANANRVLCIVQGITCNNVVCTEEHDIWIFHKTTGALTSRSTCVVCADEAGNCEKYDDTCFHAVFDDDFMMDCSLLLQDTHPVVSCSSCVPCMHDGTWGMQFDCFEGRWDSGGQCITGSRVGYLPRFPQPGDPDYVNALSIPRNDGYNRPQLSNQNNSIDNNVFGFEFTTGAIVCIAIVVGLFMGVLLSLCTKTRTRVQPIEDQYDFTANQNEEEQATEKDSVRTPKINNSVDV